MADVELVIKIPEEMAHRFKNEGEQKYYDYHTVLKACVDSITIEKHDEELLDKIKAEIEQLRNFRAENYDFEQYCDCFDARIIFRDEVFEIIDKYRLWRKNGKWGK